MIDEIKLFIGIDDELQDELLELIIKDSEERIVATINRYSMKNGTEKITTIPNEFTYIHRDVSIKRFNKMNSEGAESDSEEGRSYTWEKSYLDEYLDIFDEYTKPKVQAGTGIVRWVY